MSLDASKPQLKLATGTLQRPATQPSPCSAYQAIQRGATANRPDGVTNEAQAAYMTEQMALGAQAVDRADRSPTTQTSPASSVFW
jgi:hypothetical protein